VYRFVGARHTRAPTSGRFVSSPALFTFQAPGMERRHWTGFLLRIVRYESWSERVDFCHLVQ
jgi:hypothetical protein